MILDEIKKNPFTVKSPEGLDAETVDKLFVNVFTDFSKIPSSGHTIVQGARGSGKSMMFRYLLPDCQCLKQKRPLTDLSFFSVYIPIKNTEINLTELSRLEGQHANYLINEHFLCLIILVHLFNYFEENDIDDLSDSCLPELVLFCKQCFIPMLKMLDGKGIYRDENSRLAKTFLMKCMKYCVNFNAICFTIFDLYHFQMPLCYMRDAYYRICSLYIRFLTSLDH